jgi:hypothetical protein
MQLYADTAVALRRVFIALQVAAGTQRQQRHVVSAHAAWSAWLCCIAAAAAAVLLLHHVLGQTG